jgi:hypothetical protein
LGADEVSADEAGVSGDEVSGDEASGEEHSSSSRHISFSTGKLPFHRLTILLLNYLEIHVIWQW